MSNVATTNNSLPANIGNMAAALAQSASSAGASGAGELYLKMTKFGEWVFGAEEDEIEEGAILAINPMGFEHGWTAWGSKERGNEGTNVGEVMVPATQPLPAEGDLPAVNGDWTKQIGVQLRCTNGEDEGLQFIWKSNSNGGRQAYAGLMQEVVSRIQAAPEDGTVVPLVKLRTDSYTHKTYGKIFKPILEVVGWATMDGEQAAEAAPAVEDQTKPEPEPEVQEEAPRRRRRRKAS